MLFLYRYGRVKYAEGDFMVSFANYFTSEYSSRILEQFMTVLKNYKEGNFVGGRILVSAYQYLTYAYVFSSFSFIF